MSDERRSGQDRRTTKRPWRCHYTRDWRSDPFVRALDLESRMVYLELLDIAWDEGGLKAEWLESGMYVAQQIGISRRKFMSVWLGIRDKFIEFSPGFYSNPRLEGERSRVDIRSEKGVNLANRRWHPDAKAYALALPNTQCQGNGIQSQSQSQSQSQKEKKPEEARRNPVRLKSAASGDVPIRGKSAEKQERARTLVEFYQCRWVEVCAPLDGNTPGVATADFMAARRLVSRFTDEEAKAMVDRFLECQDVFLCRNGHALRFLTDARVDGFRTKNGTDSNGHRMQPPCAPHPTDGEVKL